MGDIRKRVRIALLLIIVFFYFSEHVYGLTEIDIGSIVPVVVERGKISISIDGMGTLSASEVINVNKPGGSQVRNAYLLAATPGFLETKLSPGDVLLEGVEVEWDIETPSSIGSFNYWADVTSIVKGKIDTAASGIVSISITESDSSIIDGTILAVIFDDLSVIESNTIVLLFGAQNVLGDTFSIVFADPIDKSKPELALDFSLGISYGSQPNTPPQYSIVDVNGERLSSSAGGSDDGYNDNGGLITVGGFDDSIGNPSDPYLSDVGTPTYDDERYDLIPFVQEGDTSMEVYTLNPSTDDNIFFAALYLGATTAIVNEGILIVPLEDTNPTDSKHMITAKVQDSDGEPREGVLVTFEVVAGPHIGENYVVTTNSDGEAFFEYEGVRSGTDLIEAHYTSGEKIIKSNIVKKRWKEADEPDEPIPDFVIPEIPLGTISVIITMLSAFILIHMRSRKYQKNLG
jgi:hypothetical protein